jgi:antitoxin component YwqK of YwqJK toxin-antitoxin module
MKNGELIFLSLIVLSMLSCGGEEPVNEKIPEEVTVVKDSIEIDSVNFEEPPFEGVIYTAHAAVDGPDDYLWVHKPGEWNGTVDEELPEFEMLHVIPFEGWGDEYYMEMTAMINVGFKIYGDLGERDVPVIFWYDTSKSAKAIEYSIIDGEPDGNVSVFYPDGRTFIKRKYAKGVWTKSFISPYCADWRFVQNQSKLWVEDKVSTSKDKDGNVVYKIMATVQEMMPGDNTLYKILEKESYQKPFQINDKVFTGVLQGYYTPNTVESDNMQFELHFKEGWLDGDVKIYNGWGELALHEVFDKGDLIETVFEIEYGDMDGMAKPIIYLYPEMEMDIQVKLNLNGHMTHSYPSYNHGWKVTAKPDGTLVSNDGKEYYALYWEGENARDFVVKEGFVIPGDKTAEFLENSLEILGLNRREANEFIVFWLPILEDNPYNLIHFSSKQYEEIAKLEITPKPETLIRVMMVYQPLNHKIDIPLQDLNKLRKKRKGFTVVEWGGSLLRGNTFFL